MYKTHVAAMLGYRSPDDNEGISSPDDDSILEESNQDDDKQNDDNQNDDQDDDSSDENDDQDDDQSDDDSDDESDKDDDEDEDDDEEDKKDDQLATAADLKKDYPDIFKKHPELRAAIYRDQAYSELFGSVKDAQAIKEQSNTLDKINEDLVIKGNPDQLLKLIQDENKESFVKVARRTISYIKDNDKDLFYDLMSPAIKMLLRSAYRDGMGSDGKEGDLAKAAKWIHKFYFNDTDLNSKVSFESDLEEDKESPTEKAYRERMERIDQRDQSNFQQAVDGSYVSRMVKYIREGLDKDERLNDYMKKTIINDILMDIKTKLNADSRYMSQMNSLWKQAKNAEWSNDHKSRIINAALARAKSLVSKSRSRIVSEALGGKKARTESRTTSNNGNNQRRERTPQRDRQNSNQSKRPLTDLDILQGKG
jgi:hypothetical protein